MELQTITNHVGGEGDLNHIVVDEESNDDGKMQKSPLFVFWKLLGFFRRVILYFIVAAFANAGFITLHPVLRQILQCLPIITTLIFTFRQCNTYTRPWHYRYGFTVLIGMLVALLGVMLTQFDSGDHVLFGIGKLIQAVAWIILSAAFGIRPVAARLLLRSIIVASMFYYFLYHGRPNIPGTGLVSQGLALQIGGVFYVFVLFFMNWRAWARISFTDLKKGRWYEVAGALGATFVIVHDFILFVNLFFMPPNQRYPLLGAHYTIELAYYLAQLFFALSLLDGSDIHWPQDVAERELKLQRMKSSLQDSKTCLPQFIFSFCDWFFV